MEATTQETEGTTVQTDSTPVEETASDTTATPSQEDAPASYDLSDVPEKLRPAVEKKIRDMELGFKRAYTQKTQSLSAKERERELELRTIKQQNDQFQAIVNDIRANPKKVDHYVALLTGNQPAAEPPPQFQTVGELMNYVENKITTNAATVEQKARLAAEAKIAEFQRVSRWDLALTKMKEDPVFKDFEDEIVMKVKSGKYNDKFTGENEHDVLKMALDDYKAKLRKQTDAVKQETLADLKKKKAASTATPKKTITTEGGPLTKEEIIARVNARVPH